MALKNPRHEAFAQGLFAGKSQRTAYREAFPSAEKWTDGTVDSKACELAKNDKILDRLEELQNAAASPLILDRQGRMIILSEMAMNEELFPKNRMQAIDLLNKMTGEYVDRKQIEAVVTAPVEEASARILDIINDVKA